jgi:hypothetical protein
VISKTHGLDTAADIIEQAFSEISEENPITTTGRVHGAVANHADLK